MTDNVVYNPHFGEGIKIKVADIETLESYIRISKEMQAGCPSDCEAWHGFQALVDAYEETLDSLRRCGNAV